MKTSKHIGVVRVTLIGAVNKRDFHVQVATAGEGNSVYLLYKQDLRATSNAVLLLPLPYAARKPWMLSSCAYLRYFIA